MASTFDIVGYLEDCALAPNIRQAIILINDDLSRILCLETGYWQVSAGEVVGNPHLIQWCGIYFNGNYLGSDTIWHNILQIIYKRMLVLWKTPIGARVGHIEAKQNGRDFADDIFKCNFLYDTLIQISPKYDTNGPTYNKPSLFPLSLYRTSC